MAGGETANAAAERIATLEEKCEGHGILVQATQDRVVTVTNQRTGQSKTYKP